jgi:isoleucyl-tRNA synthetase
VSEAAAASLEGAHFGIWTTTPWTILANLAVAVNDALDYCVVEVQVGSQGRAGQGRGAAAELLSFCSRAASCSSAMDGLAQLRRAKLSWTEAWGGICVHLCPLVPLAG